MTEQTPLLYLPSGASTTAFSLGPQLCVLGRSPNATVVLDDERVSGMHAVVWCEGPLIWIADLHSTNGTWLNGERLQTRVSIRQTATLRIGEQEFTLHVPAQLQSPSTSPTTQSLSPGLPYDVTIWYGLDLPDQVRFTALDGGAQGLITADRRVSFLYVLVRKLLDDRTAGRPEEQQGWCSDDDIGIGVWGRQWWSQPSTRLNVLVHRVRRALEGIGVNSECLQKSKGRIRLWVRRAELLTSDHTSSTK